MTRETAREHLHIHMIHTVEDFIRRRDEEHANAHPGMDMGIGWVSEDEIVAGVRKLSAGAASHRSAWIISPLWPSTY